MKILPLGPKLCHLEQITQKAQEMGHILRTYLFDHIFGILGGKLKKLSEEMNTR